ncbi:MAG: transporter [Verrucomicrobiales bacterium]|nr:transporter [Verrucomicrobiales bacterium]
MMHNQPPYAPSNPDSKAAWGNVVLAALLMLATLPGRTQGLGLITEPLLADLKLSRVTYADINLWATLLGSAACLPAGWLIDRVGLRPATVGFLVLLAAVVWRMSTVAGGVMSVFVLILLTRALGQSALSVAGITAVGKSFGRRSGLAMGVFSLLLSVFFAAAFVWIGHVVGSQGWRPAWIHVAVGLVAVTLLSAVFLREPAQGGPAETEADSTGMTLKAALRTPAFWVFAGATALFGLVLSGTGLFNEAILAERGFSQKTYHSFLAGSTLFALAGQMVCGWLTLKFAMPRMLAVSMFLYAGGIAMLPLLRTMTHLWIFAAVFGVATGFITVLFFAVWGQAYGRAHLGRIQGAAQMITVFASALGPVLFARSYQSAGSYAPLLYSVSPLVFLTGLIAWRTRLPGSTAADSPAFSQEKSSVS